MVTQVAPPIQIPSKCFNPACGKDDATKKCGRCRQAIYCGQECQEADWNKHQVTCKSTKPTEGDKEQEKESKLEKDAPSFEKFLNSHLRSIFPEAFKQAQAHANKGEISTAFNLLLLMTEADQTSFLEWIVEQEGWKKLDKAGKIDAAIRTALSVAIRIGLSGNLQETIDIVEEMRGTLPSRLMNKASAAERSVLSILL